jgi:hypothetical protein
LPKLPDKEKISDDTKEHPNGETSEENDPEPVTAVATPSSSVTSGKMRTPKRSRALVKPTTLFESDSWTETVVQTTTDKSLAAEQSEKNNIIKESEIREKLLELSEDQQNAKERDMEKKQVCASELCMNEESTEKKLPYETTVDTVSEMTVEMTVEMAVNENSDDEFVLANEVFSENRETPSCVKIDVEETEWEMTGFEMADVSETEELKRGENEEMAKPENEEISGNVMIETKEPKNSNYETEDVTVIEDLKQESHEMLIDDVDKLQQELKKIPAEYELENREIPVVCLPEKPEQESPKTVENIVENEIPVIKDLKPAKQEESITNEVATDPYVKTINDLLTLKSQQELAKLPLDLLLSCQEQLMTILSNTTTAIRLKCESSQK